ncbi:MAG: ABC transporter permease [Rhodothermaceae bacterium]|nr:ABC transporter permease [Rhodothermaceae bacterium]
MLRLLIEKELRDIIGSTKFTTTFAVCAILILLAFYVGARNYQVSMNEFEAARSENLRQMEELTNWNEVDHRIFLEPQPLAALVSGISNDIGRTVDVETRGELSSENSRFNEDPIFAVFRFLDLQFIFTVVLSLFAILFGFDAINGEKERGTLRLSFANSVPRDKYILGKLVGSFLALVIPLLLAVLVGFLLLVVMGIPMDGGLWARLGLIVLSGLMYFGVFLTLSVFISTLTEHSSTSFLLLLVAWIFAVLIIPRTAVLLSGRAVDVPSMDQINYEKATLENELWDQDRKQMSEFWRSNPPSENESREESMARFRRFMSELADAREEEQQKLAEQLNENRRNREFVQQKLALNIARVSPTASFALASSDLAGTSLELKQRFVESANLYQQTYATFVNEKTGGMGGGWWSRMNSDEEADPIDPYELPVYEYVEPETSEFINGALPDMALLMVFNLLFFAGAFVRFLKYDVR